MAAFSHRSWLLLLVVAGGIARLLFLGAESYWFDEIWAVKQVRGPLGEVLKSLAREDVHPPLYPIVLWGWIRLFGEAEWATRLFSAVVGTGAIGALYGLGRALFDRRTALVGAALLAFNAYAVFYSQETRCYSFMLLLGTLATWALVAWHRAPTRTWAAVRYVLAAIPLAYVHVFGLFVLLGHGLWALWASPIRWRMVAAGAIVAAAFAPWVPVMLGQVGRVQDGFWIDPLTWTDPIKWLWYWSGYNIPYLFIFFPLVVTGIWRSESPVRRLLALGIVVPVLVPVAFSVLGEPIFHHKYPIAIMAPLCLAAARGLLSLTPRVQRGLGAVIAVLLLVGLPWTVYLKVDKEQYREVAAIAREDAGQGAGLISEAGMRHYIGYYLDPEKVTWLEAEATIEDVVALAETSGGQLTYLLVHPQRTEREAALDQALHRVETIELRSARVIRYRLTDPGSTTPRTD